MVKKNPTADKVTSVASVCGKPCLMRFCANAAACRKGYLKNIADKKTPDITIGRFFLR